MLTSHASQGAQTLGDTLEHQDEMITSSSYDSGAFYGARRNDAQLSPGSVKLSCTEGHSSEWRGSDAPLPPYT